MIQWFREYKRGCLGYLHRIRSGPCYKRFGHLGWDERIALITHYQSKDESYVYHQTKNYWSILADVRTYFPPISATAGRKENTDFDEWGHSADCNCNASWMTSCRQWPKGRLVIKEPPSGWSRMWPAYYVFVRVSVSFFVVTEVGCSQEYML